jgi:hypothetical protein
VPTSWFACAFCFSDMCVESSKRRARRRDQVVPLVVNYPSLSMVPCLAPPWPLPSPDSPVVPLLLMLVRSSQPLVCIVRRAAYDFDDDFICRKFVERKKRLEIADIERTDC